MPSHFCLMVSFWNLFVCTYSTTESAGPPGHMQPLGAHMSPIDVERRETVPDPVEFFNKYIGPGTPVVFEEAAKTFANYQTWQSDQYLKDQFGRWYLTVEVGKYEGSVFGEDAEMSLSEFIDTYKTNEYYLIQHIAAKNPMRRDISLLKPMACGGYSELISRVLLLFSSGSTRSALHEDDVENVHCLFDGTKEWILFDRDIGDQIPRMKDNKAYGAMDCRNVDMHKYPTMQKLPWYRALLHAGDCLYLPRGWMHHVRSEGNDRNVAIAVWFGPVSRTNLTDCPKNLSDLPPTVPIGEKAITARENAKNMLYELLKDQSEISRSRFIAETIPSGLTRSRIEEIYDLIDLNKDGFISLKEVENISDDLVNREEIFQVESYPYYEIQRDGSVRDEL